MAIWTTIYRHQEPIRVRLAGFVCHDSLLSCNSVRKGMHPLAAALLTGILLPVHLAGMSANFDTG